LREASFQVCAAVSLAVHLGLALGAVVLHTSATPAPRVEASGAGAAAEHGSAALGGETFDIAEETPPLPPEETASASAGNDAPAPPDPRETIELDDGPKVARPPATHAPRRANASASSEATAASPPPAALYGAVGERGSIDLVLAFRRAFPQGAAGDPIWDHVPVGFYAEGDVSFTIDPGGTLTHTTVSAGAAPAFRAAIARTVAVIKGRPFTAKGATTRLHMVVRVSDKLTNQGRFMIDAAGSFELPSGRHVGVTIIER
jgi:hypothetical protein